MEPRLEVEVRETDPRDELPDEVEIVFHHVIDSYTAHSHVERIERADLAKVANAIVQYEQEYDDKHLAFAP